MSKTLTSSRSCNYCVFSKTGNEMRCISWFKEAEAFIQLSPLCTKSFWGHLCTDPPLPARISPRKNTIDSK